MKRGSFKRFWGIFLVVFIAALLPPHSSSAEVVMPSKVKKLQVEDATSTSATLTWKKSANADGYVIYSVDPETNGKKQVMRTSELTYTVHFSKLSDEFYYQVYAYRKNGKKYVLSAKGSSVVKVTPQLLRQVCYGNKCAFLEWDKVEGAKSYILYRYYPSKGTYKTVRKLTETNCKVTGLAVGKKYRYAVQSVSSSGKKSGYSNIVTVTGKKMEAVHGRYWTAYTKKNIKVVDTKTGKKLSLKKGTTLITVAATGGTTTGMLTNGKKIKVNGANLKYGNLVLTKSYDYYSKNQAEAFVNGSGFTSKTDWLIWISQYSASVHFFRGSKGQWKRQRVVQCVIGEYGHTKPGQFELIKREGNEMFFYWNDYKDWGQSFHGRVDANTRGAYSSGCIRLGTSDLFYLINNCPIGTRVISV